MLIRINLLIIRIREIKMTLIPSLLVLLSCESESTLHNVVEPIEPLVADIHVEAISDSPIAVSFGCPAVESFRISSVGTQAVTISDIMLMVSIQTDANVVDELPEFPLSLPPSDEIIVTVAIDTIDDVDDAIMISVSSNDPDEPVAVASILLEATASNFIKDTFIVTAGKEIDLLLVIDNSCSMQEEQGRLIDNAQYIIDGLDTHSSDYHIGVITTDSSKFVGDFITQADVSPVVSLGQQIDVGIFGSGNETGIKSSIEATSPGGDAAPNSPFLRETASLAVIWVSDEPDLSAGDLYTWSSHFWSLKPSPSDVIGWGIVTADYTCRTAMPGFDYIDLSQELGGDWTQICDESWQPTFEGIAASAGTVSTFQLTNTPQVSTIVVTVDGIESNDWVYVTNINSVSFNPGFVPVVGSVIQIEYGIADCN